MKKYLLLQLKRASRFLIWGLLAVLVLFGCLSGVYSAMMRQEAENTEVETAKIRIGVVGTAQNPYLQWGLAAMQFDSSAMSLELVPMEEPAAAASLGQGEIAAYFVFPDGFLDEAIDGNVQKLRFVSTAGDTGLVAIVKEEIISVADGILIASESGTYGADAVAKDHGIPTIKDEKGNPIPLEYVDFILDRSKMYKVETTSQNAPSLDQYMLGGLTVVLLMLSCLPFAPLYVRSDTALFQVLRARRVGALKQTLAEFLAYFGVLLVLLAAVTVIVSGSGMLPRGVSALEFFADALPTLVMVASLSYCMYTLSNQMVSGVLLSFFVMLTLCFIGGCLYPVYVFPLSVQRLATVLPTGLARQSLTGCLMGAGVTEMGPLLAYSIAFLGLAAVIRRFRVEKSKGGSL